MRLVIDAIPLEWFRTRVPGHLPDLQHAGTSKCHFVLELTLECGRGHKKQQACGTHRSRCTEAHPDPLSQRLGMSVLRERARTPTVPFRSCVFGECCLPGWNSRQWSHDFWSRLKEISVGVDLAAFCGTKLCNEFVKFVAMPSMTVLTNAFLEGVGSLLPQSMPVTDEER